MSEPRPASGEKISGPVEHYVEVRFDPVQMTLAIEAPERVVRPGDQVLWAFRDVPEGWTPWILSPSSAFAATVQGPWGVRGTVAGSAPDGPLPYRASLQRGLGLEHLSGGSLILSPSATLKVRTTAEPRLHRVVVKYLPPRGTTEEGRLVVVPQLVTIAPGDQVEWKFSAAGSQRAEGSWRPRVDVHRFDGSTAPSNLHLGPFLTLTVQGEQVTGAGSSGAAGVYNYVCVVVSRDDGRVIWKSSPDPAIDSRGDPSDPTSG
jgi:plastocyanin